MKESMDVLEFMTKFNVPMSSRPSLLDDDYFKFRLVLITEEVEELKLARRDCDIVDVADALADIVYVVIGTAHAMGLPWDSIWKAVHQANMAKVRASSNEESKRGSSYDIVKPAGWVSPEKAIRESINNLSKNGGDH